MYECTIFYIHLYNFITIGRYECIISIYDWHHWYSINYLHVLLKVVPDLGRGKWAPVTVILQGESLGVYISITWQKPGITI